MCAELPTKSMGEMQMLEAYVKYSNPQQLTSAQPQTLPPLLCPTTMPHYHAPLPCPHYHAPLPCPTTMPPHPPPPHPFPLHHYPMNVMFLHKSMHCQNALWITVYYNALWISVYYNALWITVHHRKMWFSARFDNTFSLDLQTCTPTSAPICSRY